MSEEERVLAWHWLRDDGNLAHVSPPQKVIERIYTCGNLPLKLCEYGMHGSVHALDGLKYAEGAVVCRVELWGDIERDADKLCARYRKVLWMADATSTLHEFAGQAAEAALLRERQSGQSRISDAGRPLLRNGCGWRERSLLGN